MLSGNFKQPVPPLWQKVVLRILLASIVICFTSTLVLTIHGQLEFSIYTWLELWMPLLFVLLHHILRLWTWKWWWGAGEILWSLIELGGVLVINITTVHFIIPFSDGSNNLGFMLAASWLVIGTCSSITLFFLLWDTLHHHGKNLGRPYYFLESMHRRIPGRRWGFAVFGNSVMRKRFSSDTSMIQSIRGGLAILCFVSLSYLAFFSLLGQPLQQSGQVVVKTLRVSGREARNPGYFGVDIVLDVPQVAVENIPHSVLNVTILTFPGYRSDSGRVRKSYPYHCSGTDPEGRNSLVYSCFLLTEDIQYSGVILEVLFTINFSAIPNAAQQLLEVGFYPAVQNSSVVNILANTKPIYLVPGSHLFGSSWFSFKDQISNRGVAALGIPQYQRVQIMNVDSLSPDWLVPNDSNTATLRLRPQLQDEMLIEREYYENSVISGFALLGGVWTIINGLFAAIFGSTLLLVLFGIKPLSIYGLVHFFRSGKRGLVEPSYVLPPEERDRFIATLRKHILDVDEDEDVEANQRTKLVSNSINLNARHGDGDSYEVQEYSTEQMRANPT